MQFDLNNLSTIYPYLAHDHITLAICLVFGAFLIWSFKSPISIILEHITIILDKIMAHIAEQKALKEKANAELANALNNNSESLRIASDTIKNMIKNCNYHKQELINTAKKIKLDTNDYDTLINNIKDGGVNNE